MHSKPSDDPYLKQAQVEIMSKIEALPLSERREQYRQCAYLFLIRYLIEQNLIEKKPEEEGNLVSGCESENADGIAYIFDIDSNRWEIQLHRKSECREALQSNPEAIGSSEFFKFDLGKPAKVQCRNANFYN